MPEQLLSQLAPLRTPSLVDWWPPAPGWWILTVIVAVLLVVGLHRGLRHRRANRYRRQAATVLRGMGPTPSAVDINEVLKITALTAFPHQQVASLSGDAWIDWLRLQCPTLSVDDLAPLKRVYQRASTVDTAALHRAALHWVERHGRPHV